MNYVEYRDEEIKEQIFEGTYILDGLRITEEEQRRKIFDLMSQAGVEVGDESKLEIGYEGVEDDNGISEVQTSKFIVTRRITKKVPYKVTKEEVFEGTFILDGLRLTEEQQRDKIYNLMIQAGVFVSKEEFDTYEIGYDGVEDDNGISETQTSRFVVYKVTKERIDTSDIVSSKDDLSQVLDEIKSLRDKLNLIINDVSKGDVIQELVDKTEGLEKMVSNNEKANSNVYTEAIKEIDQEIVKVEKLLKDAIKAYEESYEKMRHILEEQNDRLNSSGLLSDEEYNSLMNEFLVMKMEENERTIRIKKEIEIRKKQIASLKKRKNKIKKDLANAEALGISASQYQSITNTLMKKKIVNAILETKGLDEIIAIPYKERTKEQQDKLKEAKEQIIEEIAKLQKQKDGMSVLDAIEALYGLDIEMQEKGKAKEYKVTKKELKNIKDNVALLPEKIVGKNKNLINNNVLNSINPTDAPDDMLEVYDKKAQEVVEEIKEKDNITAEEIVEEIKEKDNITVEEIDEVIKEVEKTEIEKPIEIITLFIDEASLDVYARKYVFDRFHLEKQSDEVIIDGSVCYKLDEEDADYIIENKDNLYSPYLIETKQLDIEKERVAFANKPIEKITFYIDVDNNNEIYGNRYLFSRFNMDIMSDEVKIDGKICYRMDEDDAAFVLGNQDNSYSPYVVETRKIQLGKREEIKEEEQIEKPIEKITFYIDTDNNNEVYGNRYLFSRFNMKPLSREVRIDGKVCYRMDEDDAAFILGNKDNDYSPYLVEIREVHLGKKDVNTNDIKKEYVKEFENINSIKREKEEYKNDIKEEISNENLNNKEIKEEVVNEIKEEIKEALPVERIVLYRDADNNGEVYGRKYLFDRFNMDYSKDEVRIDGALCYRIENEDLDFIIGNQDNSYSPYKVEIRGVNLGERKSIEEVEDNKDDNTNYPIERIVLYRDLDNGGIVYGKKYLFDRFHLDYIGNGVRIDGALCYQVDFDDADFILGNQNNSYSPYVVEIIDTQLGKNNGLGIDNIDNLGINSDDDYDKNYDDDNDFLSRTIIDQPPIIEDYEEDVEDNKEDYNETKEVYDNKIEDEDFDEENKEIEIDEEEVEEDKDNTKPRAEEILESLTKGLDIGPKDAERYVASNIHVNDKFKKELQTGNVAYNVLHFVPGVIKASVELIRKLSAKLLLSGRGKYSMMQLEDRLEDLSEEELEVLFEEYISSHLNSDISHQINPIIIDRLRRYGLEKVANLNNVIKEDYSVLFVLLGQVKALDEKLQGSILSDEEASVFMSERNKLMKQASLCIIHIKESRKQANDLLSGGIEGLEEDFKAVASKLKYVGSRFNKTNEFDNQLQHRLGQYGQGLNVAIANNDYDGVVSNFMNLESLYFKGESLANNNSSANYYNALAEQFEYRADGFVNDLLSDVAITSATVNAINAIRVYQIENGELAKNVGVTDNAISKVELDMDSWSFNNSYNSADRNGRNFYNAFNDKVIAEIGAVANKYSSGDITQDVALKEMAIIKNNALGLLMDVCRECIMILRKYAATHPDFDLVAVEEAIRYLTEHPDVISNMTDNVVELDESLKELVNIPSSMFSTLMCACSSVTLATNVVYDMENQYNAKNMFNKDEDEEVETRSRRR